MSSEQPNAQILDAIKAAVKTAITLARESRWDEFYSTYATLFSRADFSSARQDDQRQALKLMILTKGLPPPTTQNGIVAYQSAWRVLRALVEQHQDPRDYELLGLTHLRLTDENGAKQIFQAGYELAQRANDGDLCGAFLRHLSNF